MVSIPVSYSAPNIDNLDIILRLDHKQGEDNFTVSFEKHRNFGSAEASPVYIEFQIDDQQAKFARQEDKGKDIIKRNQEICKLADTGIPQKDIAEQFNLSKSMVSQIVKTNRT